MPINGSEFWNPITTQFVEEAILSLDPNTLTEALSQRIGQVLTGNFEGAEHIAETVSHKVGSLVADLYGEVVDIDHLVESMSVLNQATRVAFERRTGIGFQETIQSHITLLLNGIKVASDMSQEKTSSNPTTAPSSEVSIATPSAEPEAIINVSPQLPLLPGKPLLNQSNGRSKKIPLVTSSSDSGDIMADEKEAEKRAREGGYESSFKAYMKGATKYDLLTRQQELDLARQMKDAETETMRDRAREKMIVSNLRLVVKIAFDYKNYGMQIDDLIQEGNIGLMKAIERFDPSYGAKLSTYAAWWIKQSIKRALANQSRDIRLPVHMVDKIAKMRRVSMSMMEELGREPSDDELADELGIDREKLYLLRTAGLRPTSLDTPLGEDGDTTLGEVVGDESGIDASTALVSSDLLGKLPGLLKILDSREREIIERRFGLNGYKPQTLEEVGELFKITRERIRQLQNIALEKMRRKLGKMEKALPATVQNGAPKKTPKTPKSTIKKSPVIVSRIPEVILEEKKGAIIYDPDTRFMLKHAKNGTAGMRSGMTVPEIALEVGLSPEDTRVTLIDMGLLSK